MWRRNQRPKVQFVKDDVVITFTNGKRVRVKAKDEVPCDDLYYLDDGVTRTAYDVSVLNQTSHLPRSIMCPITRLPMCDPVVCADGNSYERSQITAWLKRKKTSPVTGAALKHTFLLPNHCLRNTISELIGDCCSGSFPVIEHADADVCVEATP